MHEIQSEAEAKTGAPAAGAGAGARVHMSRARVERSAAGDVQRWAVEPLAMSSVFANDESRVTGPCALRVRLLRARGYNVLLLQERLHTEIYAADRRYTDSAQRENAVANLVQKFVLQPALDATNSMSRITGAEASISAQQQQVVMVQLKD